MSSVAGSNLTYLRQFFNEIPSLRTKIELDELTQRPSEFQVDELFDVQNVGTVLAGTVRQGVIREGDELIAGPTVDGKFFPVVVSSIHRNKTVCRTVQAGQAACVATKQLGTESILFRRVSSSINFIDFPSNTISFLKTLFFDHLKLRLSSYRHFHEVLPK